MTSLIVPVFPDNHPAISPSLTLRATLDLDANSLSALRDALAEELPAHSSFRHETSFCGEQAELSGLIGIHKREGEGQSELFDGPTSPGWIHYNLRLATTSRPRNTASSTWDRFAGCVANTLRSHVVQVNANWFLPSNHTTLGVALPIALGSSELPGFKEIRGVRLSQPDPDSKNEELYSLILDQARDETIVQVRSSIESVLDDHIMDNALARCISIVELAVEFRSEE